MTPQQIVASLFYFVIAGLCEIAGGYFVWIWLKEHKHIGFALAGALLLILYGIIPTFQPAHFGRVYAAYGGVFIAMALLWGWGIDKQPPDRYDLLGAALALIGVAVIMYWPRT